MSKLTVTNPSHYPTFYELPSASEESSPNDQSSNPWCLLAQIKENMTITKPTLIVTDRTGVDFALLFEDNRVSLKGFRKGYTVAVPHARRTDREDEGQGKKAVVRVPADRGADVKVSRRLDIHREREKRSRLGFQVLFHFQGVYEIDEG
jgi:hypothetical protein